MSLTFKQTGEKGYKKGEEEPSTQNTPLRSALEKERC